MTDLSWTGFVVLIFFGDRELVFACAEKIQLEVERLFLLFIMCDFVCLILEFPLVNNCIAKWRLGGCDIQELLLLATSS